MKKHYSAFIAVICLISLLLSGCSQKYLRISFATEGELGTGTEYMDSSTALEYTATDSFPVRIPVYKISERKISTSEFNEMLRRLGLDEDKEKAGKIELNGNKLSGMLVSPTDESMGYITKSDSELEKLAWDVFNRLPFIEGEYECLGIRITTTLTNSQGKHILRAGVSFRRLLGDYRVVGNDRCDLIFDNTGLAEIYITLYDYKETGHIDIVPLEDAAKRIKDPDQFIYDDQKLMIDYSPLDKISVDKVKLMLVNQYSRGCKVLQPVYVFSGTAEDKNGAEGEFKSLVIAIPEEYTYEVE